MTKFSENVLSTIRKDLDRDFFKPTDENFNYTYYHSLRVANAVEQHHPLRFDLIVLAYLHDVIEDTGFTLDDLRFKYRNLFHYELGDEVTDAFFKSLNALTRRPDETYMDYISRVKEDENARKVKILDLSDNIYNCAINKNQELMVSLKERYIKALTYLIN